MTGNTVVDTMPAGTMTGTPQLLLAHHLKQLKRNCSPPWLKGLATDSAA